MSFRVGFSPWAWRCFFSQALISERSSAMRGSCVAMIYQPRAIDLLLRIRSCRPTMGGSLVQSAQRSGWTAGMRRVAIWRGLTRPAPRLGWTVRGNATLTPPQPFGPSGV